MSAPPAPRGSTTTWVTKWASDSSPALRRSTSRGYTPLLEIALVGYSRIRWPLASVGSSSNANGVRLRDGGRPPPLTLSSNAVRLSSGSCTVSTTRDPGGTFAAWKLIRNVPSGATHGLWAASANDGTTVCAPADGANAATPATEDTTTTRVTRTAPDHRDRPRTHRPAGMVSKPNER